MALLQEGGTGRRVTHVFSAEWGTQTHVAAERGLATPTHVGPLGEWLEQRGYVIPDTGVIFHAYFPPAILRDLYVRSSFGIVAYAVPKLRGAIRSVQQLLRGMEFDDAMGEPGAGNGLADQVPAVEGFDRLQHEAFDVGVALRSWAPCILARGPSSRQSLNQVLSWIDRCVTHLTPQASCQAINGVTMSSSLLFFCGV